VSSFDNNCIMYTICVYDYCVSPVIELSFNCVMCIVVIARSCNVKL